VSQTVAVCCSAPFERIFTCRVLQCVAVCCSMLQCVTVAFVAPAAHESPIDINSSEPSRSVSKSAILLHKSVRLCTTNCQPLSLSLNHFHRLNTATTITTITRSRYIHYFWKISFAKCPTRYKIFLSYMVQHFHSLNMPWWYNMFIDMSWLDAIMPELLLIHLNAMSRVATISRPSKILIQQKNSFLCRALL